MRIDHPHLPFTSQGEVSRDLRPDGRRYLDIQGNLVIYDVIRGEDDIGAYQCIATEVESEQVSASRKARILVKC